MKVCIINGGVAYHTMFKNEGWEIVHTIEEANLVQFCGGADVTPSYYGELKHPQTSSSQHQDMAEASVFNKCVKLGKRMAGICRGGQFLHVMNNGDLWQHVQHHAIYGHHGALDLETGVTLAVTSTHHQMMREPVDGRLILVGHNMTAGRKEHMIANGDIESVKCDVDVEAVYYEETKCFCFQPHPEMDNADQCRKYYFLKLEQLLGLKA